MDNHAIVCGRFCKLAMSDCRWQLHGLVGHIAQMLSDILFNASAFCMFDQTAGWICDSFCTQLGLRKAKLHVVCGQSNTFEAKCHVLQPQRPQCALQTEQAHLIRSAASAGVLLEDVIRFIVRQKQGENWKAQV